LDSKRTIKKGTSNEKEAERAKGAQRSEVRCCRKRGVITKKGRMKLSKKRRAGFQRGGDQGGGELGTSCKGGGRAMKGEKEEINWGKRNNKQKTTENKEKRERKRGFQLEKKLAPKKKKRDQKSPSLHTWPEKKKLPGQGTLRSLIRNKIKFGPGGGKGEWLGGSPEKDSTLGERGGIIERHTSDKKGGKKRVS